MTKKFFFLFLANTHASNDCRVRSKETRCENRIVRHGSHQVSVVSLY